MEYNSSIKGNELLTHVITCVNLKIMILSKRSKTKTEFLVSDSMYS